MKKTLLAFLSLAALILSCSLPGNSPSQPDMMTAAALTVQAAIATKPLPSETSLPPVTNTSISLATATESAPPLISVGEATDCRKGPSENYERVTQIQPGQPVEIVGYLPPDFWVVKSSSGECWISAALVTPTGSTQSVPTVTAPPTPNGNAPKAPSFPKNGWSYVCPSFTQIDVTFNWNDNANNETGYRIYRDEKVIAELPPNSTTYSESVPTQSGQSVTYRIEAYNLLGKASTPAIVIQC